MRSPTHEGYSPQFFKNHVFIPNIPCLLGLEFELKSVGMLGLEFELKSVGVLGGGANHYTIAF